MPGTPYLPRWICGSRDPRPTTFFKRTHFILLFSSSPSSLSWDPRPLQNFPFQSFTTPRPRPRNSYCQHLLLFLQLLHCRGLLFVFLALHSPHSRLCTGIGLCFQPLTARSTLTQTTFSTPKAPPPQSQSWLPIVSTRQLQRLQLQLA